MKNLATFLSVPLISALFSVNVDIERTPYPSVDNSLTLGYPLPPHLVNVNCERPLYQSWTSYFKIFFTLVQVGLGKQIDFRV